MKTTSISSINTYTSRNHEFYSISHKNWDFSQNLENMNLINNNQIRVIDKLMET
jgi:hypothetical protein